MRIAHNIFHGLELGHVHARFHRHVQIYVASGEAGALVAGNRFAHIAFAPVVGSQCKVPIAKLFVEAFQIVQSGARRGLHITSVVAENVLFQIKTFARSWHELPHASGARAGYGLGVESTFYKRKQGQLGWHIALFEFFNDVKEVFARAISHAL